MQEIGINQKLEKYKVRKPRKSKKCKIRESRKSEKEGNQKKIGNRKK